MYLHDDHLEIKLVVLYCIVYVYCAGRVFFSGVGIWLGMTFNYPVLWVRFKGQG